jgi:DNA-directed RNA polymerase subunit N (RpoN/RPB10)
MYNSCPSCNKKLCFINNKWLVESEKICNNPKLNTKEKEVMLQELLLSFKLKRYCCKMRVFTCVNLFKIIDPIPKENI